MAKESGLGDQLFIGGRDIGADTSAIGGLTTPRSVYDMTGITKSAFERILGTRDASGEFTGFFNSTVGQTHDILKTLPTADTQLMYLHGTALGNESFVINGKQLNYDFNRPADGSLTVGVHVDSNGFGGDWTTQLTAGKRSDVTATNGTGVDLGSVTNPASAAFGFIAYLQVFSFTGTSVTIKLQESSDNAVGDPFADVSGGAFTVVSAAPTFERIQSVSPTLTVERYLRVVTTGTFSQCTFAVTVARPDALRIL